MYTIKILKSKVRKGYNYREKIFHRSLNLLLGLIKYKVIIYTLIYKAIITV